MKLIVATLKIVESDLLHLKISFSFFKVLLEVVSVALIVLLLLFQTLIVKAILLLKLLDHLIEHLDLLSKRLLNRVGLQEACNFLLREEVLLLDKRLHVAIAIDDGLNELCEVVALATVTLLTFVRECRVVACIFRVDRLVSVPLWEVALRSHELIDSVAHLDDFLGGVDHIVVSAGAHLDLQVGPDDRFLVKESGQDLLLQLVLHVEYFRDDEQLITVVTLVS